MTAWTHLIRGIADAHVKEGKVDLAKVSQNNIELFPSWCSCNTLVKFGGHPRVHLHDGNLFRLLENPDGQVSRTGTDF